MLLSSVSRSTIFKTVLLFGLESKTLCWHQTDRPEKEGRKEGTSPTLRHQKEGGKKEKKRREPGRDLIAGTVTTKRPTVRGCCCPSSVVLHLLLLLFVSSSVFFGNLWRRRRRRRTVQGLLPLAPQQKVQPTYH
jgi:hypothetical protein